MNIFLFYFIFMPSVSPEKYLEDIQERFKELVVEVGI